MTPDTCFNWLYILTIFFLKLNETIYNTVKSLMLPQTAALESIGWEKLNHRRMECAWIWGTLQLLGLMGGTILPCFPGGNGNFRDNLSPGLAAAGSFTVKPIQVDGVWAYRDNRTFWAQESPAMAYTWAKLSNIQGQAGLVIIVVAVKVYIRGENKISSVCCLVCVQCGISLWAKSVIELRCPSVCVALRAHDQFPGLSLASLPPHSYTPCPPFLFSFFVRPPI